MAQAERPDRLDPAHRVTVEDVRALIGGSTPHFAMQLRTRIRRLIAPLAADDPARIEGEREIARLTSIAFTGEVRGEHAQEGMGTLKSVDQTALPTVVAHPNRR